mmetsp:Transcript_2723/g.7556  ORF Transcript_2723/g.7556 Transcript_2723/m.7556 type:complete len:151 (-) Transcript_2723:224-676(-)
MDPGLGPLKGLPTYRPPHVAEEFELAAGNHLHSTPASFILEGVVGFNPNTAREIRELRRQLATVESTYQDNLSQVHKAIDQSQGSLNVCKDQLNSADLDRFDTSKLLAEKKRELAALQPIIDQEYSQLLQERRKLVLLRSEKASQSAVAQ